MRKVTLVWQMRRLLAILKWMSCILAWKHFANGFLDIHTDAFLLHWILHNMMEIALRNIVPSFWNKMCLFIIKSLKEVFYTPSVTRKRSTPDNTLFLSTIIKRRLVQKHQDCLIWEFFHTRKLYNIASCYIQM